MTNMVSENSVKEKEYAEVAEYAEFEDQLRDSLEAEYTCAMFHDDLAKAYDVLGKLMSFKLIDSRDPRLTFDNADFKKAGIPAEHRFRLDYRSGANFIPEWLYGDLCEFKRVKVQRIEHWMANYTNSYDTEQRFKSVTVDVEIRELGATRLVESAFDNISNFMKNDKFKPINIEKLRALSKRGIYRVYSITSTSTVINYSILGYAVLTATSEGLKCYTFFNTNSIIGNWFIIKDAVKIIRDALETLSRDGCKVLMVNDFKDAIIRQNNMITDSKAKGDLYNKRVKQLEEKQEQLAAEKAAKEAAKAAKAAAKAFKSSVASEASE